jgi:hypothetical protein
MDLLAHSYEIKVCPKCGQQTDRWCYEHGLDMIAGERVEAVPADAYRGAVDLVERARGCVTAALNCTAHPWHGDDRARKWLMDADRLGGQS